MNLKLSVWDIVVEKERLVCGHRAWLVVDINLHRGAKMLCIRSADGRINDPSGHYAGVLDPNKYFVAGNLGEIYERAQE